MNGTPVGIAWGSVADWVSGTGSLAAVVTALYLARSAERIKLTGYCGIRLVVGGGGPQAELVFLSVTNVGSRTAVISNIGMTTGRFKKRYSIITFARDAYSDGIPVTIQDGQGAKWGIPLEDDRKWLRDLADDFLLTEADAKSLRFVVHTTHGKQLVIKPEKPLVDEVIKGIRSKATHGKV